MPPENFRFGGGPSESILHPIVLVAMAIAILLIFLLPRRHVILPVLCSVFLIPLGQEILIGGLHFFVYRIIILAVGIRMLVSLFSSPEGVFGDRLGNLDVVFVLWAFFRASASILSFSFQSGAVINQCAFLLDAIGGFFVLRYLIRDDEDIYRAIRGFAVISAVVACFMIYERFSGVNLFGALGGVRMESEVRNGSVRSQGPFQHELLAGTFGATILPLFFLLWKTGKSRALGIVGAAASTVMVLTSQSSTPLLAYLAAVGGISCFALRRQMRLMRWGIVAGLIALQMVMNAPVWYVIRHIDVIGGSSGYHRARLVNDFIMHFRDWWLIGTTENARWGFNMWDLCNQFVAEGEVGGLATFICFVTLVCLCFSKIGRARKTVEGDRAKEWFFWSLGCALFSHVIAFFGISYFDQTRFAWFALLAIITTATAAYLPVRSHAAVRVPIPHSGPRPTAAPIGTLRSRIQSRAPLPLKWPAR